MASLQPRSRGFPKAKLDPRSTALLYFPQLICTGALRGRPSLAKNLTLTQNGQPLEGGLHSSHPKTLA